MKNRLEGTLRVAANATGGKRNKTKQKRKQLLVCVKAEPSACAGGTSPEDFVDVVRTLPVYHGLVFSHRKWTHNKRFIM